MEYSADDKVDVIRKGVVEYNFDDYILLLVPDRPSWILVNKLQYKLYKELCKGRTISETIENVCNSYGYLYKSVLKEMQIFISMSVNNGFLVSLKVKDRVFEQELVLYITEDCNLRCKHCFVSAGKNNITLTLNKVKDYLYEYSTLKPEGKVLLTGGEPFLHPDINQIVEFGYKSKLKISINTNGTLLNREWLYRYGKMLHGLQISIDGFTPDVHDSIRGKGSFEKSWQALKYCMEILPEEVICRISVSVFPQNVKNIKDNILSSLDSLDPNRRIVVVFNPVVLLGRAHLSQTSNYAFIYEKLQETIRELDNSGWFLGTDIQSSVRQKKCGIGEYVVVRANGKMAPCNFSNDQNEFTSLRQAFEFFKKKYTSRTVDISDICSDCDVRYICFGGCQVMNELEGKGPLSPKCGPERIKYLLSLIVEDELAHRNEILQEVNNR